MLLLWLKRRLVHGHTVHDLLCRAPLLFPALRPPPSSQPPPTIRLPLTHHSRSRKKLVRYLSAYHGACRHPLCFFFTPSNRSSHLASATPFFSSLPLRGADSPKTLTADKKTKRSTEGPLKPSLLPRPRDRFASAHPISYISVCLFAILLYSDYRHVDIVARMKVCLPTVANLTNPASSPLLRAAAIAVLARAFDACSTAECSSKRPQPTKSQSLRLPMYPQGR